MDLRELIEDRRAALGIRRGELARRMGYRDPSRGCRRIDRLLDGDVELAEALRARLAAGLSVEPGKVDEAIRGELAAQEAAYRAAFKPHAIARTRRERPEPVFIYAMCGGPETQVIGLEEELGAGTFARQALLKLPDAVPGLGAVTSYVVNYSPDRAVEYDLAGDPVREFDRAIPMPWAGMVVGGKRIGSKTWSRLMKMEKTH